MQPADFESWTYDDRLKTFAGHWEDSMTAARLLAAVGHACDRPPVESLVDGSRCVSCGAFVSKDASERMLGDSANKIPCALDDSDIYIQ